MALGGNVLRQHVVEFIRGVGVVTDGVVDATSLNGPWSWQVPDGVAELTLDGCGAGGGGAGGSATGARLGGGGGGGCGLQALSVRLSVTPLSLLTIAVGAGGLGSNPTDTLFTGAPAGGDTRIDGVLASPFVPIGTTGALNRVLLLGGSGGEAPANIGEGGNAAAVSRQGAGGATVGNRGTGNGGSGATNCGVDVRPLTGGSIIIFGAGGGGSSSTTPSQSGGAGAHGGDAHWIAQIGQTWGNSNRRGNGNTTGTESRAGGGCGAPSVFATFPKGGDGGQVGTTPTGYGAGGGGGGGGAAGGNGADGYVRFTYWSMD